MPFAIELFLDGVSAAAVRRIWRNVAEADLTAPTHAGEARPHVSLAVYDDLDASAFETVLQDFAAAEPILPICLARLDVFRGEQAVVYLAPDPRSDLLAAHRRFHRHVRPFTGTPWAHYLPGRWQPHCTLAEKVPSGELERATRVCADMHLPLYGRLDEVGVAEFPPIHHRYGCTFAGV